MNDTVFMQEVNPLNYFSYDNRGSFLAKFSAFLKKLE